MNHHQAEQAFRAFAAECGYTLPSAQRIIGMVRAALRSTKGGNKKFLDIVPVSDAVAVRIKEDAGLDVAGYTHSLDEAAVRHINNRHGDPAKEAERNQIAITEEDFARLPEIVTAPDEVSRGRDTDDGMPTVVFKKQFPDTVHHYVQEVRKGRKKLAAKTLWKTRSVPLATAEAAGAHTYETPARSTSTGADSVSSKRANSQDGGAMFSCSKKPKTPEQHADALPYAGEERGRGA